MDKYEEIRVIGRGAFGTAVLVREKAGARRELVLKALPCEGEAATRIEDARNEARLLASSRHPNGRSGHRVTRSRVSLCSNCPHVLPHRHAVCRAPGGHDSGIGGTM